MTQRPASMRQLMLQALEKAEAAAQQEDVVNAFQLTPTQKEIAELKIALQQMLAVIETSASKSELQAVWRSAEHLFANKAETQALLTAISKKLEAAADKSDLISLAGYVAEISKGQTVDITISSAELLALNTISKSVISAPGEGKCVEILRIEFFYDFETTPYASVAGKDLSLEYDTSGQIISVAAAGILDQSADKRLCVNHSSTHLVGVNEAVVLKMAGGEVTAGDSPLKVRVNYKIFEVLS